MQQDIEKAEPQDSAEGDRRHFLETAGKAAFVAPAAMLLFTAASPSALATPYGRPPRPVRPRPPRPPRPPHHR